MGDPPPELVADWLDASLFVDPVARAAFVQLSSAAELHDALATSEGEVRALLERLAVEEPEADAEPETVRARLVVNLVEPAAERLLRQLLADGDDRASQVKVQLDVSAELRPRADGPPAKRQRCSWYAGSLSGRPRERPRTGHRRRCRPDAARSRRRAGASPGGHRRVDRRASRSAGFVTTGEIFAALPDLEPETGELAAIYAEHGAQRHPGRRRDPRRARARGRAPSRSRRAGAAVDDGDRSGRSRGRAFARPRRRVRVRRRRRSPRSRSRFPCRRRARRVPRARASERAGRDGQLRSGPHVPEGDREGPAPHRPRRK